MLLLSGDASVVVNEIWRTKATRSFYEIDGRKRVLDLVSKFRRARDLPGRYKIYPGKDARVRRVLRKVVRGLCYHHGLFPFVRDRQLWVDVLREGVPAEILNLMEAGHRDPMIFRYRWGLVRREGLHSYWLLTFYENKTFQAAVFESVPARYRK
jgi:hypothetical protein